ncbi:MAG TPA: hypothetical protein VG328_13510 [Stellaceae bacterium]|jgi:hypothetical protein|nr:hypothetical protein [Stellaceae bacterium]
MKWLWPRQTLEEIELTIAIRAGRFLHWSAIAFVGVMWLGEFVGVVFGYWHSSSFVVGLVILAGIAIFLLGRGLRYVFANE